MEEQSNFLQLSDEFKRDKSELQNLILREIIQFRSKYELNYASTDISIYQTDVSDSEYKGFIISSVKINFTINL